MPALKKKQVHIVDKDTGEMVTKTYQPKWSTQAVAAWDRLWSSPQAIQWPEDMRSIIEQWIFLYESFTDGDFSGATVTGLQRIEDKLGLNPKAMLQLRWRHHPAYLKGEQETTLASVQSLPERPKRMDPRKS